MDMISTRGRYALRVMLDLAQHEEEGYVSLKTVAERQAISMKYLEMIVGHLKRAGLVDSSRGKEGGYCLLRAPEDYTAGEILRSIEDSLAPVACLEKKPNTCARSGECATLFLWEGLEKVVADYLDGVTLRDILERKSGNAGNNYVI